MKNNVTNFPELHSTIYAAAVATVRMLGGKIKNNPDYSQNKQQTHHGKAGSRNKSVT
jgi:hypothetical protein